MKRVTCLIVVMFSFWGAAPLAAQDVIESYVAYIGRADLYNSKGVRLTQPWQILQQDRANFHRFGISQDGDQWDSFFGSIENRTRIEQLFRKGDTDPFTARDIVEGNTLVMVYIHGRERNIDYIYATTSP